MVSHKDKRGFEERVFYNFAGRAQHSIRKDGSEQFYDPVQTQVLLPPEATVDPFDSPQMSRVVSTVGKYIDPNGNIQEVTLDKAGQARAHRDTIGQRGTITRNDSNLIVSSRGARNQTTTFSYDDRGNVLSVTDSISVSSMDSNALPYLFPNERYKVGRNPKAMVVSDFDADGIMDVATANYADNSVSVLLLSANGSVRPSQSHNVGDGPVSIAVGDFNADSISDLSIANSTSNDVSILLGRGDGTFLQGGSYESGLTAVATGDRPYSIVTDDLNGDGSSDVVIANIASQFVNVLLGNPDGSLQSPQSVVAYAGRSLVAADFDGDGVVDLANTDDCCGTTVDLLVHLGNGDGTFRTQSPSSFRAGGLVAVDIDLDGIIDLASSESSNANGFSVYLGNGDGTFEFAGIFESGVFGQLRGFDIADVNRDGLPDAAFVDQNSTLHVLLQEPASQSVIRFIRSPSVDLRLDTAAIALADVSNDGTVDLVSANETGDIVTIHGDGSGVFGLGVPPSIAFGGSIADIGTADFNNDGMLDIATALSTDFTVSVALNDDNGLFQPPVTYPIDPNVGVFLTLDSIQTADFNGDGNIDILPSLGALATSDVAILFGDGNGGFTERITEIDAFQGNVGNADFNRDGIADLILSNPFSRTEVWLGSSTGDFTFAQRFTFGFNDEVYATPVDINSDQIVDLVFSNSEASSLGSFVRGDVDIFLGNGDGSFLPRQRVQISDSQVRLLATGDFTDDDVTDLVVLVDGSEVSSVLVRGDASGVFASEQADLGFAGNSWAGLEFSHAADFDTDGTLDIVTLAGSAGSTYVELFRGSDDLALQTSRRFSLIDPSSAGVVGDFDGTGTVDLALVQNSTQGLVTLLYNDVNSDQLRKEFAYDDRFSQLTSVKDELRHLTLYELDPANGNSVKATRVVGDLDSAENGDSDDLVTTMTYGDFGLLDLHTDELGRVTDYDYDPLGRLVKITYAVGTNDEAFEEFEYDGAGNQTAVIDENGNRTEFAFDDLNRLTRIVEPDPDGDGPLTSPVTIFTYDAAGNLETTTDAEQSTIANTYDPLDRLETTTDEQSNVTRYGYDHVGNLTSVTDPLQHETTYEYDARNRLRSTTDPDGGITTYEYDPDDNLVALVDPVGNRTGFRYDARDRLVTETDPLGESTLYEYDAVNSLIRKTDRNGRITNFVYDDIDRLVTETWVDADGMTVVNTISYEYDDASNLKSVTDVYSSLAFEYDHRDRVASVDNAGTPDVPNVVLSYDHDGVGNVLSVTDTIDGVAGATTSYAYDPLNRLGTIQQSGSGTSDKLVDFVYNQIGQYDSISRYGSLDRTGPSVVTDYDYDNLNRLARISHDGQQGNIAFYDYEYDAASRIEQIESIDGNATYTYDDRNQLRSADYTDEALTDEFYTYDENGNRVSSHRHGDAYETDDANRLSDDGTFTYEHDDEGSLILRTAEDGSKRQFTYDHRQRLTSVTGFDSDGTQTQLVEYVYDSLDRRIAKIVTSGSNSPESIRFVYDGEDVILDFEDGSLKARYLHGTGIDEVLAQEPSSGASIWHLTDHLGTTRDLVKSDGEALQHFQFDAYGNVLGNLNPLQTRYLFTGREYDPELDLFYYRARIYDATLGSFNGEDPLGVTEDANNRRYVQNQPTLLTDPFGLESGLPYFICQASCLVVLRGLPSLLFDNTICRMVAPEAPPMCGFGEVCPDDTRREVPLSELNPLDLLRALDEQRPHAERLDEAINRLYDTFRNRKPIVNKLLDTLAETKRRLHQIQPTPNSSKPLSKSVPVSGLQRF